MDQFSAEACANIALIKYMGKSSQVDNLPANPSISMRLDYLKTKVVLQKNSNSNINNWKPLKENEWQLLNLDESAQRKFLSFFEVLQKKFGDENKWDIYSANNFPSDCGLASSASSFAALTQAALQAFQKTLSLEEMSKLSRLGSGSSCRSFFKWALWNDDGAEEIISPWPDLMHFAVVVSKAKKKISSSQAHKMVTSSPQYENRPDRAIERARYLTKIITAPLSEQDWARAYQIIYSEFEDMHTLFETCKEAFSYKTKETLEVLQYLKKQWMNLKDGPLVTMDAGPNIHLIYRKNQSMMVSDFQEKFGKKYQIIRSG